MGLFLISSPLENEGSLPPGVTTEKKASFLFAPFLGGRIFKIREYRKLYSSNIASGSQ